MEVTSPKKRGRKLQLQSNPISTKNKPSQNLQSMKYIEILNHVRSLQKVELSPLVVEFSDIPNREKIPCVSEQSFLFKFMYLLKKAENNAKYFSKYTVIRYGDRYVAIKPFNSKVTAKYLNETRLGAINKILDQVFISK